MTPPLLQKNDEIRVIALSISMNRSPQSVIMHATKNLEEMGFCVTFGKNVMKENCMRSSSVEDRIADWNDAIADPNVKMILAATGGYNVNQILPYIDMDALRANPKRIAGYSDITALNNAIYATTGIVTYQSPNFITLGMQKGLEYTLKYFKQIMTSIDPILVERSSEWSDDYWEIAQDKRTFMKNDGPFTIQEGKAEGTIIGGNLCTLNLLQGTPWMPSLKNSILFIEDDDLSGKDMPEEFDRNLVSLMQLPDFSGVQGIVIGRNQKKSEFSQTKIMHVIKTKKELSGIPVIANTDFGHTTPRITLPIGGTAHIRATTQSTSIEIEQ